MKESNNESGSAAIVLFVLLILVSICTFYLIKEATKDTPIIYNEYTPCD